jgi:formylglycine-generating enzyme required for sulfatase activity
MEDLERVRPIVRLIEGAGWSVFWDRRIPSGMTWRHYIGNALDEARCVVVVWSKHAVFSKFVIEEADDGNEREILVPVLIDGVRPPLGFRSIQCEDFRAWNGDPDHRRVKSLLTSIERVTGKKLSHEQPSFQEGKAVAIPVQQQTKVNIAHHSNEARIAIPNEVDGYELVKIPAGRFMMGSPEDEKGRFQDEGPRHEVHVPAFFMGRYPVTNAQYARYLKATDAPEPEYWANRQFNQPRQPVTGVNWEDAQAYARWAGLRLPSEAEWEYACRAGTSTRFHCGDGQADLKRVGWYTANSEGRLHLVGEKEPNAFGLYDMHGNVWEWVEDDWHDTYDKAPPDGQPWIDTTRSTERVFRGGGFGDDAHRCRAAARLFLGPRFRTFGIGFRLARSVPLALEPLLAAE